MLGLLSDLDLGAFGAYCQAFGRWAQAERLLTHLAAQDTTGRGVMLIKTKAGGVTVNPLAWIARSAANDMTRYAAEFGFTPSARTRISSTGPPLFAARAEESREEGFDW
jgi:P27 family predicted phage terminase small subunit